MQIQYTCPECGEHTDIGTDIVMYVNYRGEPVMLKFTHTCLSCNHSWVVTTGDFHIDLAGR